jgi:mRNA export factor
MFPFGGDPNNPNNPNNNNNSNPNASLPLFNQPQAPQQQQQQQQNWSSARSRGAPASQSVGFGTFGAGSGATFTTLTPSTFGSATTFAASTPIPLQSTTSFGGASSFGSSNAAATAFGVPAQSAFGGSVLSGPTSGSAVLGGAPSGVGGAGATTTWGGTTQPFGAVPTTAGPVGAGPTQSAKQIAVSVEDSLSGLAWSPSDQLAVSSWDGSVSVLTFQKLALSLDPPFLQSQETKLFSQKAPLLDVAWSHSGDSVISCSAINNVISTDVNTSQSTLFRDKQSGPLHQAPVKCIATMPSVDAYVTGSWDSHACIWSAQGVCERRIPLPERCYAVAARGFWLVFACANRQIRIIDIRKLDRAYRDMLSPLKFQSRAVDVATNQTWFAVTSVEGRCSVVHFAPSDSPLDFTFKCHRLRQTDVYPVNDVHFHPVTGAFATIGNDGIYNFWDKESRNRLKSHEIAQSKGLVRGRFNSDGSMFAIATSYDWSQGPQKYYKDANVYVHATSPNEVTLRSNNGRR